MLILSLQYITASPVPGLDIITYLNMNTCVANIRDITVAPTLNRLYVYGTDGSGNERIGEVDISDIDNPSITTCSNLGNIGTAYTINVHEGAGEFGENLGGRLAITYDVSGNSGSRIYNLTTSGALGGVAFQKDAGTGDAYEIQKGNLLDNDISIFLECEQVSADINEIDALFNTLTNIQTVSGGNCEGLSEPFLSTASPRWIVAQDNIGLKLIDSSSVIDNIDISEAWNNLDAIDVIGDKVLFAGTTFHLLKATQSEIINLTSVSPPNLIKGVEAISNNTYVFIDKEAGGADLIRLYFYEYVNDTLSYLGDENFGGNMTSSVQIETVEYSYPYIYVTQGGAIIAILSYSPSEYAVGTNKKPVFTSNSIDTTSIKQNNPVTITADAQNPETSQISENILTTTTCDYSETVLEIETFDNNYNFTSVCAEGLIGTVKNTQYSSGLSLTSCLNDVLVINQETSKNAVISFDIYSNTNGSASFQFITYTGDVILDFNITRDTNNQYSLNDETNNVTILSGINSLSSGGTDVPIRFFAQYWAGTDNSNLDNVIYWGTNYYSQTSSTIDAVFCDGSEYCYIGDYASDTNNFGTNYYALRIENGNSDLVLDNYKVKTVSNYPTYSPTTSLSNTYVCNYSAFGKKQIRVYLSDEIYGHNYLYSINYSIIVSASGDTTSTQGLYNSSIIGTINELASLAGVTDSATQQALAFIIIIVSFLFMLGLARLPDMNLIVALIGAIVVSICEFALFLIIGWIPVLWLVLLIVLMAGILVYAGNRVFGGS